MFLKILCTVSHIIFGQNIHTKKKILSIKNNAYVDDSTNPKKFYEKISAIEKFVNLHAIALGLLQLISIKFKNSIWSNSKCWLRTFTSPVPSIFMTKIAITNIMKNYFNVFVKNPIIDLIFAKQDKFLYNNNLDDSA